MFDLLKIGTFDALEGAADMFSKPGQILGLYAIAYGVHSGATAATAKDIGQFILTRSGEPKHNLTFDEYQRVMNSRGGVGVLDSTAGAGNPFEGATFLPFFEEGFATTWNIREKDELNIAFQPGANVGALFSSLNVEIWARIAQIPERYEYLLNAKNGGDSGEKVTAEEIQLPYKNLSTLYVVDTDDVLDKFSLDVNGHTVQSIATERVVRAVTLQENPIEDSTYDTLKIPTYTPGKFGTAMNHSSSVNLSTSAAGKVRFIMGSINR